MKFILQAILLFLFMIEISAHRHQYTQQKVSKRTRRHLAKQKDNERDSESDKKRKKEDEPKGTQKCNPEVAKAFGLKGTGNQSDDDYLDVCGLSQQSCCSNEDQKTIVDRWTTNGSEKNLQERMESHLKIINQFYAQAQIVQQKASLITQLPFSPSKECLFMARRIDSLKISQIFPIIERNYKRMHEFLQTSYKGVQCAVCDPETNALIFPDKKQIVLSQRFCRDVISNSLNALLYNHDHIPRVGNFMVTFIDTCNSEGEFLMPEKPAKSPLVINEAYTKELKKCKKIGRAHV